MAQRDGLQCYAVRYYHAWAVRDGWGADDPRSECRREREAHFGRQFCDEWGAHPARLSYVSDYESAFWHTHCDYLGLVIATPEFEQAARHSRDWFLCAECGRLEPVFYGVRERACKACRAQDAARVH